MHNSLRNFRKNWYNTNWPIIFLHKFIFLFKNRRDPYLFKTLGEFGWAKDKVYTNFLLTKMLTFMTVKVWANWLLHSSNKRGYGICDLFSPGWLLKVRIFFCLYFWSLINEVFLPRWFSLLFLDKHTRHMLTMLISPSAHNVNHAHLSFFGRISF